jgi:signal transduction histidine kinase
MILLVVDVVVGVPIAAAIAIFRYHLYDLNLVVRRTLIVAAMALAITVVYVAIVVAVPVAVGVREGGSGSGFDPLPFVAAAAIALLFDPLRRWARRVADRLVFGNRATPYEVLTAFGERAGETYSTDDVLPRLAQVLTQGTGAGSAVVWLHVGGELVPAATWPAETAIPAPRPLGHGDVLPDLDEQDAFEVLHQGELLGALTLRMPASEPMDPAKAKLVRDLATQAGLLLRNVRLIEELRASRQRLVAAQDEERRRLERNLHDGAQQQLVALAVRLKLARSLVDRDPGEAGQMLDALHASAGDALDDLRDLARGIYPPLLADKGLAAALEAQARKAVVPTTVETDGIGRFPQEVEAAVYFSVLECLNNVSKYAGATRAEVALARENGRLSFRVHDDGRGFDPAATGYGTGLQGIADRLDAIGGRLEVRSIPGSGATVSGSIPTATP